MVCFPLAIDASKKRCLQNLENRRENSSVLLRSLIGKKKKKEWHMLWIPCSLDYWRKRYLCIRSFEMLLGYKVKSKKDNLRGKSYLMNYSPSKTAKLRKKSIMFYLHGGGVNDIKDNHLKNQPIPVRRVALFILKDSYYNNLHNFHQSWNTTFKMFFPCWIYKKKEEVLIPPW